MMGDQWTYQDDDFNEDLPYIELQFGPDDLHLLYKSVSVHLDKWPGGNPEEQERLQYLKNFLYRVVLEYKFQIE
tara:strand:- start:5286 stop:5507 length:222 start_codon:yes stop_codon:yes gene_type:complete